MPQKTPIKGLKIIRKGALMWQLPDGKIVRTLSHIAVAEFKDNFSGSYYEMMYFHLN